MAQVALQFHADPVEIEGVLLPQWLAKESPLFYAVWSERGFEPTDVYPSPPWPPVKGEVVAVVGDRPFGTADDSYAGFLRDNLGCLVVSPGRLVDGRLTESIIGAVAGSPQALKRWRRVISRARRSLHQGTTMVAASGARASAASHRYSDGAEELYRTARNKFAKSASSKFVGVPGQGHRFTHYVEIDVSGLKVQNPRENVFVNARLIWWDGS